MGLFLNLKHLLIVRDVKRRVDEVNGQKFMEHFKSNPPMLNGECQKAHFADALIIGFVRGQETEDLIDLIFDNNNLH